jgi:cytochrome c
MRRILYNPASTEITKKTVNQESIMKRITLFISSLALIGLVLSPALNAGVTGTAAPGSGANVKPAGELVIKNNYCVACHNVNVKMVGPAFKDIAAKYTEADREYLVEKIQKGSMGVWGQIPMPPNAVDEQQANQAITYILNLK